MKKQNEIQINQASEIPEFKKGWGYYLWKNFIWWTSWPFGDPDKAVIKAEKSYARQQFRLERDKDYNKYRDIMTYINQTDPQAELIDLSYNVNPEKLVKMHKDHYMLPENITPELLAKRWVCQHELRARTEGSITTEAMNKAFASILKETSNENLSNKIGEIIIKHANYINDNKENIIPHDVIAVSITLDDLCIADSGYPYFITYPTLTKEQVKEIASIYLHHYPAINASSRGKTLTLEAHVILDRVLPLISNFQKRPSYIEHPKTYDEMKKEAGISGIKC
jgi:hypothetical protein